MASMRDQAHTVWREIAEQSYHFARHEKVSGFFKLVPVAVAYLRFEIAGANEKNSPVFSIHRFL